MSTNLKIAIAEPSVIIRSGLENLLETVTGFPYPDGGDSFGGISFRLASYAQTGCVDREPGFARLFHVATFEGGKRLCRDEMYRFVIFCLRQYVIAFL